MTAGARPGGGRGVPCDRSSGWGAVRIEVTRGGRLLSVRQVTNVITDAGDLYVQGRVAAGVGPGGPGLPGAVNGVKVGTGTLAPAKSGAGAALGGYISGGTGLLTVAAVVTPLGPGLGVSVLYQAVVAADAAMAAVSEAVLVVDADLDIGSPAEATVARVVFPPVSKPLHAALTVKWTHVYIGGGS